LELKVQDNGKILKPKASYTLTTNEAKLVCRWIKKLKMSNGYSSNLARCIDVKNGMKSHDCHVFMEILLPNAFSDLLIHVLNPLTKISHFFKDLCSTTLKEESLSRMEKNIPIILYRLERIFSHVLFDSMEHLYIYLPHEALLGGPMQYRWMYPFERYKMTSLFIFIINFVDKEEEEEEEEEEE